MMPLPNLLNTRNGHQATFHGNLPYSEKLTSVLGTEIAVLNQL
jgi:hypothetical protein